MTFATLPTRGARRPTVNSRRRVSALLCALQRAVKGYMSGVVLYIAVLFVETSVLAVGAFGFKHALMYV